MSQSPAFSFYAKDFMLGTVTMSLNARGAYITLLAYQWDRGSVPTDPSELGRVLGCTRVEAAKSWTAIAEKFQPGEDGLWRNKRLEVERTKQVARRDALTANGRKGGRPIKQSETQRLLKHKPNDNQKVSETESKQEPNDNQNESLPSPSPKEEKQKTVSLRPPKEPADGRVKEFLTWFQSEYKVRRHGADYLVKWDRDGPLVKQMLGATALPRLQKLAQILLSDKTDEPFIAETDRGVGILSVKFNWLSERLAAWEARQKAVSA